MNVLILAASPADSTSEAGYPVFLSEINGESVLEQLAKSVANIPDRKNIYAFAKQELEYWNLDAAVAQIAPDTRVITVEKKTAGALCTALLAAPYITNDEELLILSANEILRLDLAQVIDSYKKAHAGAGIMYFDSIHPRYAFARINAYGDVEQVAERRPISRNAIPGAFWFAKGADFVDAGKKVILKDNSLRDVFYISTTINEFILAGIKVASFPLEKSQYIPLKTTKLQERFEFLELGKYHESA